MGEYGAVGGQGSNVGGGRGGENPFADVVDSVARSLGDLAEQILALPPLMLLALLAVVLLGGLMVFRRV